MADVKKIIKDIKDKDLSGSNEQQGAFAEMIKGLAFSDDPLSNEFMKKVDKAITKIADETLKKEESVITIEEDIEIIQDDKKIILEKGDKIEILNERAPLVGSLVGKKIVEVRDLSESHGYVKLLFSDNTAIHMNDWDWFTY